MTGCAKKRVEELPKKTPSKSPSKTPHIVTLEETDHTVCKLKGFAKVPHAQSGERKGGSRA